ncbi:hypothetical protein CBR_g37627 [Chara braunii]|uniref:DUF309 domain-containing protein n=1 Tax=Chara braunii TaxID=69332 RepID=A0A388LNC4_CHABU|nr:hypothetical protein CBR_g37627 [Chara braunii]|eukprot:GBG83827.1 hypothetical protein CBR_g37627 [Chara braunii]
MEKKGGVRISWFSRPLWEQRRNDFPLPENRVWFTADLKEEIFKLRREMNKVLKTLEHLTRKTSEKHPAPPNKEDTAKKPELTPDALKSIINETLKPTKMNQGGQNQAGPSATGQKTAEAEDKVERMVSEVQKEVNNLKLLKYKDKLQAISTLRQVPGLIAYKGRDFNRDSDLETQIMPDPDNIRVSNTTGGDTSEDDYESLSVHLRVRPPGHPQRCTRRPELRSDVQNLCNDLSRSGEGRCAKISSSRRSCCILLSCARNAASDGTKVAMIATGLTFLCPQKNKGSTLPRSSFSWRDWDVEEEQDEAGVAMSTRESGSEEGHLPVVESAFEYAVSLFNLGEYYKCHDVLESLWHNEEETQRALLQGVLQCAVGLYHLVSDNHRGAMMQMGEGVTRLRMLRVDKGPIFEFESGMSAVLEFVYNTQLEYAACSDDVCVTMDGSEQSYKLLGNFAKGKSLYCMAKEPDAGITRITFSPKGVAVLQSADSDTDAASDAFSSVVVPTLRMTEEDLRQPMRQSSLTRGGGE